MAWLRPVNLRLGSWLPPVHMGHIFDAKERQFFVGLFHPVCDPNREIDRRSTPQQGIRGKGLETGKKQRSQGRTILPERAETSRGVLHTALIKTSKESDLRLSRRQKPKIDPAIPVFRLRVKPVVKVLRIAHQAEFVVQVYRFSDLGSAIQIPGRPKVENQILFCVAANLSQSKTKMTVMTLAPNPRNLDLF